MTTRIKVAGELRFHDAAAARAAFGAMLEGRAGNPLLEEGAKLEGASIRFAWDGALSVSGAQDEIDSAESGIEKAIATAHSGEVLFTNETGASWTRKALSHPFWQRKWDAKDTGFHEGKPNDFLESHLHRLERKPKLRVFVPLCGKSADLRFLAARGHEVVGVDVVINAIAEFFAEKGLDLWQHHRPLERHPSFVDGNVTLICGDIFDVPAADLGRFSVVYDRAALVALEPSTRERYVTKCRKLLEGDGQTLLIALSYDQAKTHGPPWSVSREHVDELFPGRTVTVLGSRAVAAAPRFVEAGVSSFEETAYLIS